MHTYRGSQEFQNILERKLWSVMKNVKHGIENDIDSTYGDIRLRHS